MSYFLDFAEVKLSGSSNLDTVYHLTTTGSRASSDSTFVTFDDLIALDEIASTERPKFLRDASLFEYPTHTETIEKRRLAANRLLDGLSEDLIRSKLLGSVSKSPIIESGPVVYISPHQATASLDLNFEAGTRVPISFDDDLDAFDDLLERGIAIMDISPQQQESTTTLIKEGMHVSISATAATWDGLKQDATGVEKFKASFVVGDWRGTIDILPPGLHQALLKLPTSSSTSKIVLSPSLGFGSRGKHNKSAEIIPPGAHVLYQMTVEQVSGSSLNMEALKNGVLEELSRDEDEEDDVKEKTQRNDSVRGLVISATSAPVTSDMLKEASSSMNSSTGGLRGTKIEGGAFKMPSEDEAIKLFLASQGKK